MLTAARKSLILFTARSRISAIFLLLCITIAALLEMLSIGLVIPLIQKSVLGPERAYIEKPMALTHSTLGLGRELRLMNCSRQLPIALVKHRSRCKTALLKIN